MNYNTLPPIIIQKISELIDSNTPEHIKYNHMITLENIRDCIDSAIKEYSFKQSTKKLK